MAGQVFYVINVGLIYGNCDNGIDVGLFYNVKGEMLQIVGIGLYLDVYFQFFYSLNFSFNKKLGVEQNMIFDFGINNILNDEVESFYQFFEVILQVFNWVNLGVFVSVGISYKF